LSRSFWDYVLANAFWMYAVSPVLDIIEVTRGGIADKLVAAHTSLQEQAERTGAITLTGAGLAALIWAFTPVPVSAMTCIGAGGTLGLVSGLYFWSARRQLAQTSGGLSRTILILFSLCAPLAASLLLWSLYRI
jgi:hypothetical protein